MADNSKIEWTDATWNPVTGCTKVSPGCDHCYAERITERFHGKGSFAVVRRDEAKLYLPLRWRKPRRIFVNSMSDLFHEDVPDGFAARVFATMARAQQHSFQVLTKRHGRMRAMLNAPSFVGLVRHTLGTVGEDMVWPLPNVWLGVSCENQQWADIRIPALLDTPAVVRWVSAEPFLGPIDLHARDTRTFGPRWLPATAYGVNAPDHRAGDGSAVGDLYATMYGPNLDWVVTGGESGPNARPADPDWFRQIRDQCVEAGVAYLHKQNGGRTPKANGRELDGRTWDQYPDTERSTQ